MELNRIVTAVPNSIINPNAGENRESATGFSDFLKDAMGETVATDAADKLTNIDTVAGGLTDLHTATIAAEQADLALQLTVAIRNKVVDAYNEVMRMSL
ncbi:flagellar hook-basal body complex protein FliE [Oscillospiraceae bacterium OttesenSCG-928-F05]|nr:flagellar hook-basal body complex protein FliE [Oscillospiraceae bacterium OttesenSCG-928-F05]